MIDQEGCLYYYLCDHLGSVRVLCDTAGTIVDGYGYYPFGEARGDGITLGQSYRFTGKPFDSDNGLDLYYFGARYYDPELGRFLAIDPRSGSYPGWSPYVYGLDNPLRYVDPDGEWVETAIDVISIGLSAKDFVEDPSWQPGRSNARWKRISSAGIDKPETLQSPGLDYGNRLIALDLIRAIETDTQPEGGMYDGRSALEMILAIYESHRLNAPVELPLKNRRHPLSMLSDGG